MRRSQLGVITTVTIIAVACGGTEPKGPDVFQMAFAETTAQQYGVPGCAPAGDVYCRASIPSDRAFSGTLRMSGGDVILMADGSWAGKNAGSVGFAQISLARGGMCGAFVLSLSGTTDDITGTWTETFDCHGRQSSGTVVGHRQ